MTTSEIQVTDRILVFDVHTSISDDDLRMKLLPMYEGIKHVHRCYTKDDPNTPRNCIQIQFKSSKYAQQVLEDGSIDIGHLRCRVKAIKPTLALLDKSHNDTGSNCQSEILEEEHQVTDRILLHDVSTKIADTDIEDELLKLYGDVQRVKRWFSRDTPDEPTERVEVNFRSSENTKTILEKGYISIGRSYFSVTPLKPSMRLQRERDDESDYQPQSQMFSEQFLLDALAEQKRQFCNLIGSYDAQLTKATRHLYNSVPY